MSEPKRYILDYTFTGTAFVPTTRECKDGELVRYADYARLKAEVERLTKAEWQPIETAPKDGSWIIVCWNELKCGCEDLDEWLPGIKVVRWHWDAWHFCSEYSIGAKPTHWMPLPSEPAKQGGQP